MELNMILIRVTKCHQSLVLNDILESICCERTECIFNTTISDCMELGDVRSVVKLSCRTCYEFNKPNQYICHPKVETSTAHLSKLVHAGSLQLTVVLLT